MWPWRRRVEPVLRAEAGDDATAALATILYYHGRRVSLDEIRRAIYTGDSDIPNALQIVDAAVGFGLRAHGVTVDHPSLVPRLPTPNIAHLVRTPGPFPRNLAAEPKTRLRIRDDTLEFDHDTLFAAIASVTPRRVDWIDPYRGLMTTSLQDFVAMASGIFLVFEKGAPMPRAKLVGK